MGNLATLARAAPRVGETHDVEVESVHPVGKDFIVQFRDRIRVHRRYVEVYSLSEFAAIGDTARGLITWIPSRALREGRWVFTPTSEIAR